LAAIVDHPKELTQLFEELTIELSGVGVKTLVQKEDAQALTEPIVKPIKLRRFQVFSLRYKLCN
jgi:hypothetical protein